MIRWYGVDFAHARPQGCPANPLYDTGRNCVPPVSDDRVSKPIPLCIVEHPASQVSDCGMALTTTLTDNAIHAAHRGRGNGGYRAPRIVPEADVPAFMTQAGDELVPPAREFLFRLGLLDQGL